MRVNFPAGGLQEGLPAQDQEVGTSFSLQNVRPFDVQDERIRGGKRPGLVKAYDTQVVGSHPIISISSITSTYIEPETP